MGRCPGNVKFLATKIRGLQTRRQKKKGDFDKISVIREGIFLIKLHR
jgi:hypothetical protein